MRRRTILILAIVVGLPLAVVGYSAIISAILGVLTITTDKAVYSQGETITFTVRNNGLSSLEFSNPGLEFSIMNLDTGVYVGLDRIYPQVIHNISPLAWETTSWDQTEITGREENPFAHILVNPGNYAADVRTAGGFEPNVVAEVKFRIS